MCRKQTVRSNQSIGTQNLLLLDFVPVELWSGFGFLATLSAVRCPIGSVTLCDGLYPATALSDTVEVLESLPGGYTKRTVNLLTNQQKCVKGRIQDRKATDGYGNATAVI